MPRPNKSGRIRPHVRDWLKAERRTQEWLADQIGDVHQTTVSHWYRGGEIPLEKAIRIAQVTGLSIEEIAVVKDDVQAAESSPELPATEDDETPTGTA